MLVGNTAPKAVQVRKKHKGVRKARGNRLNFLFSSLRAWIFLRNPNEGGWNPAQKFLWLFPLLSPQIVRILQRWEIDNW